jgi:hypothetical protein
MRRSAIRCLAYAKVRFLDTVMRRVQGYRNVCLVECVLFFRYGGLCSVSNFIVSCAPTL